MAGLHAMCGFCSQLPLQANCEFWLGKALNLMHNLSSACALGPVTGLGILHLRIAFLNFLGGVILLAAQ